MEELYTLQREVGRGSYGVVFEGHMCQTGQKVAIKRLACRNPECMELYLQELWAMRSTGQQHANIIQLHRCLQQTGPRTLQALRPGQLPLRLVESVLKGTVSRTKHSPLQHRRRRSQGRKRLQDRTNSVQEDPLTPYRPPRKGSYGLRLQDRTNVAQEDPLTPHRPPRKGSYGLRLQEKTNSVQEDPLTPHRPPSKGSSHSAEMGAGPMRCLALWLVMEFCDGGNLNHFLLSRAPDQRSNHSVVQQLSAAVAFLHHLGIMHRDLKPDNVLVCVTDRGPVVKVADFGLSKMSGPVVEPLDHQHFSSCGSVVDPLTPLNHRHFSSTCGSDFYMAPEVWGGVAYTAQADIFSLGVMFWAVLERITFVEEGTTHQQLGAYVSRGRWLLPLGEALWENPALQLCIPMKGFKRGGAVDRPRPPGPATCSLLLHMLQPDPDARPQADQLETRVQEALEQDQDQDLDQEPH